MAREYARVKLAIWADPDFRKLTDAGQALYFRLLSSPTMSLCGVADWRPRRLAALTADVNEGHVRTAAQELIDAGYVVVDEETEEVLVRSFVRHDGLIKTPNIASAMVKDYAGTASEILRGVIVHELHRLHLDNPEMKGWATASQLLSHAQIDPSAMPYPMPSVNPSGNESHIPHPLTNNQQPSNVRDANPSAIAIAEATERFDVQRICDHLASAVAAIGSKRPVITKGWLDAARLMLDKDGRTEAEVIGAIDWCQSDEFWRANILSLPKLREKYDQLRLQAQRRQGPASKQQQTDDIFDNAAQRMGVIQ